MNNFDYTREGIGICRLEKVLWPCKTPLGKTSGGGCRSLGPLHISIFKESVSDSRQMSGIIENFKRACKNPFIGKYQEEICRKGLFKTLQKNIDCDRNWRVNECDITEQCVHPGRGYDNHKNKEVNIALNDRCLPDFVGKDVISSAHWECHQEVDFTDDCCKERLISKCKFLIDKELEERDYIFTSFSF